MRSIAKADATDAADAVVFATDAEAMQVGVIPAHRELQDRLEISDGAVAAHEEPAPEQGRDLTQPDVELRDVNDGGRFAHGIASLPRLTVMSSQCIGRQPPLCDGLIAWPP